MNLLSSRALSEEMPALSVAVWRTVPPAASSTLPYSSAFIETPRFTSFSSSTWRTARRRSSVEERIVSSRSFGLDRRVRPLEVEAGGQLSLGLVEGVADLLLVDLGDDIKGRHGA